MGDVGRIVHAQPDAHDQQHRGRRVHRQAPEVHEPHHVNQGEDDAEEDEDGARDVGEHEDDDEKDADEGKDDAPVKLHRKDPVNLPELVSGENMYIFSGPFPFPFLTFPIWRMLVPQCRPPPPAASLSPWPARAQLDLREDIIVSR